LYWSEGHNHSARFHSDEMDQQGYFAHDSACTVVSTINASYPTTCNAAASCACVGGTKACGAGGCTLWNQRVALFGVSPTSEIISNAGDPNGAFYSWLFEPFTMPDGGACAEYILPGSTNGHRWEVLKASGGVGIGQTPSYATGDFGPGGTASKIPSGSHYPRQAASLDFWANWYDTSGPQKAQVNVDGTCTTLALKRGAPANGAYSVTATNLATGCHRYYFTFLDGNGAEITWPTTGSLGVGPAGTCADWDTSRPASCAGGADAGVEAGVDAGSDAGSDAGVDAGVDAGTVDSGPSGGTDSGSGGDAQDGASDATVAGNDAGKESDGAVDEDSAVTADASLGKDAEDDAKAHTDPVATSDGGIDGAQPEHDRAAVDSPSGCACNETNASESGLGFVGAALGILVAARIRRRVR
jgi:hypothetical protein